VRENQRRHRARRRDHIATLEQKLAETEEQLAQARAEIAVLKAERDGGVWNGEKQNLCINGEGCKKIEEARKDIFCINVDGCKKAEEARTQMDLVQLSPVSMTSPRDMRITVGDRMQDAIDPSLGSIRLDNATVFNILGLPSPPPTTTPPKGPPPCCLDEIPNPSPEGPECTSCATRPAPSPLESTTLCSQAYVLIQQQNFRGIDALTIRTWLYQGFRRAQRKGEGCRVENTALMSLLDFISGL
jgi:hypothetical protein